MPSRYLYNMHIGTTIDVAVRVNGVTIQKGTSETQDGITGPVDHHLQPGANELEVEIVTADRSTGSAYVLARVVHYEERRELAVIDWRGEPGPLPPAPPFPIIRRVTFDVPADHPPPPWDGAAVEPMPSEGTEEAWKPVRDLHGAMERGDKDAVHASLSTRAAEHHRIHGTAASSPEAARKMVSEGMVGPYAMAPIGPEHLEFRSAAGGRAVQVLRRGPGSAIGGHAVDAPKVAYQSDPLLVRRDGVWTIVG